MSLQRSLTLAGLLAAAHASFGFAADGPSRLLQSVPAGAPMILHVRDLSAVLENWQHTPFAKMWADPQIRAFFAPAAELLNDPEAEKGFAQLQEATGMAPAELIRLLPGEFVFAMMNLPSAGDEEAGLTPQGIFGAVLGENREKIEELIEQAREKNDTDGSVTEEFQGETLYVQMEKDEATGETREEGAWAIVDDIIWFGTPKTSLQEIIANYKRGGADRPVTTSEGFAAVYRRDPEAQAAIYVDLGRLVELVRAGIAHEQAAEQAEAAALATEEGGGAVPQPSMMQQMGLTPDVIVKALGLDALRGFYGTFRVSEPAIAMTMGVTWTEQRGLLRLLAYGDAPAPQPHFVPPGWSAVNATRFRISEVLEAIKEVARNANPMLEFMLTQQLDGLKQQTGVDLEKDFFGSFGDELVVASSYPKNGVTNPMMPGETLLALPLANAESFTRVLDVAWSMAPMIAQQFQNREYLGHTIRTLTVPMPGPAGTAALSLAYAITPTYLFVDVNGTSMVETAIQRLNGEGEQFWTQPEVVAALQGLPSGSSGVSYQELAPIVHNMFRQWSNLAKLMPAQGAAGMDPVEPGVDENGSPIGPAAASGPDAAEGLRQLIDPDALPSQETLEKYWSTATGATYREADGVRFVFRIHNAE